ncbi:hypothetical protein ACFL59_14860 [Planctomycetota bacterium]
MRSSFVVLWGVLTGVLCLPLAAAYAQPEEPVGAEEASAVPGTVTDAADPAPDTGAATPAGVGDVADDGPGELAPAAPAPTGASAADSHRADSNRALGFTGLEEQPAEPVEGFLPVEDRWRIGFPSWERYPGASGEQPYESGAWYDPYHQNVLKGDYPVFGEDIFLNLSVVSDTLVEGRSIPVPSGVSTENRKADEFFDEFDQFHFNQNIVTSLAVAKGDTAFRPRDLALKATAVFNGNYLDVTETNVVNVDVRDGTSRLDGHIGLQELFFEYQLGTHTTSYDFTSIAFGIQPLNSDFRGFLFNDNNLGVRLFGTCASNQVQWNVAWFNQLEKDTNSGLNKFRSRDQNVVLANVYLHDFLAAGYTAQLSYHYNHDDADTQYDDNGFLVRPAKIGAVTDSQGRFQTGDLDAHYLGWGGNGCLGWLNLSHQYYFVFGRDQFNQIAGRRQTLQGHFAAVESSVDLAWLRFKGSFLYASGDKNPKNSTATGFDTIMDNPFFAGSGFSYFNRQSIPFVQSGVQLVNRLSLLPSLRSSKVQGKANFVNPGLFVYNVGASARITPKLFLDCNLSVLRFSETEVLEFIQVQRSIDRSIGLDYSVGLQYRPLLSDNVILTLSGAALTPGDGFRQLYTAQTLYSTFAALTLTY